MISHIEEERRIVVLENRVLRVFEPKWNKATRRWKQLLYAKFQNYMKVYSDQIKENEVNGACSTHG